MMPKLASGDDTIAVSIIIEWENADRIGDARAERMLDELSAQIVATPHLDVTSFEVLIVCQGRLDSTFQSAVKDRVERSGASCVCIVSQEGDYFKQKNIGADHARGELLIFLDSDVIPQPGWLAGMLANRSDDNVAVTAGQTIIRPTGWYPSAIAMTWIFPWPQPELGVRPTNYFWANNFAISAETFARYRFPDTGQFRGECVMLAASLARDGKVMLMDHAAVVDHPPPEPGYFLQRGYRSGRDLAVWLRHDRPGRHIGRDGLKIAGADFLSGLRRIRAHRREVGMGLPGAAGAAFVAAAYNTARYLGFCAALLSGR